MRKIHHFGVPVQTPRDGEVFNDGLKVYLTDIDKSPNRIEFLRFVPGSPMHELIQSTPHIAYEVDSLEEELKDAVVLFPATPVNESLTIAFIEEEGIPLELMEIKQQA